MSDTGEAVAVQQPDWELSKENFQPLKAGRKPGGLTIRPAEEEPLTTDQQREKFEKSIAEYQGDDPLELWLSYIKWTRETFPAGGHKADLLPLLERATRALQGLPRYADDVRYLRVWVQYADCLPDPTDVFKFLKEQGIGQGHALFYEAHAALLERRGAFSAADNVYQQGVNRGAEPLDRLKSKHEGFQHRMARRIQRKAAEQAAAPSVVDPADHPERQSLAVLGGRRSVRSTGLGATGKRKAVATPGRDNAPAGGAAPAGGNSGLEIFIDEEFGGPAASAPPALAGAGPSTSTAAAGAWTSLPSFEAARKENTQKASSWAGQRMKQVSTLAPAPAPALAIPLDPEFAEAEMAAVAAAAGEPSLRQRLDRGGIDEQLAHDPLRLHRAPAVAAAVVPAATKVHREEVLACNVEALKGEGGEELCFEELRARAWVQHPQVAAPAEAAASDVEMEAAEEDEPAPPEPIMLDTVEAEVKATPFDQPAPAEAPAPAATAPPAVAAPEPAPSSSNLLDAMPSSSDVTMNTRGAFDAINAAFGGRFGGDAPALALEPTMTFSTREAFAAINTMFGTKSSSFNSDVTMNTKAAFDALNAAFGGGANPPADPTAPPAAADPQPALFIRQDTSLRSDAAGAAAEAVQEVHPALAGPSGGLDIREDTVFIGGTAAGPADSTAAAPTPATGGFSLGIREDTVFINPRGDMASTADTAAAAAPTPGGFAIREDTIFINRGPSGDAPAPSTAGPTPGGFSIREDTIFINRVPGAAAALPEEEEGPTPAPGGLGIREDTIFINRGAAGPSIAPCPVGATPTVALGALDKENAGRLLGAAAGDEDDTVGVAGGMASKWGFAPGADDTLAFPADGLTALLGARRHSGGSRRGDSSPAASPRRPSVSTGLTEELRGINLAAAAAAAPFDGEEVNSPAFAVAVGATEVFEEFGDENAGPRGRSSVRAPRDVRDAAVAPLALRALSPDALAKLDGSGSDNGAVLEENSEAEAALASSPPRGLSDEFQVFADPEGAHPAAVVVEPFSSGFQAHMLGMLSPPVAEWPGVASVSADQEAAALAAFKRASRGGGIPQEVSLGSARFAVGAPLGAGAYATVYAASDAATGEDVALKVEAPACPWEWYVCRVVGGRVPAHRAAAFIAPTGLALGPGASVTAMPRGRHGSLQDLLNAYLTRGERPDEALVARLGAGLLRALGDLHTARILHNDIKPDNLLVSLSNDADPSISVQLIDFGRAVDLALLPPGSVMAGDCGTEGFRCVEMREGRPWVWQADAYGAAGCIHTLLFGEYMEVERVMEPSGEARLRIKAPLKRYWQRSTWDRVFSMLLNWNDAKAPPPWGELADELEVWVEGDRDAARREQAELNKLAAWL